MSWARRYALRNVAFSVAKEAANYGTGEYGSGSYGQETSDPLPNTEYLLVPMPGQWPSDIGWVYRVGEKGRAFSAQCRGRSSVLDLSTVSRAALVIDRASVGSRVADAFELTIDPSDNSLRCEFDDDELDRPGSYRIGVQLVFDSGRIMSVTTDDSVTLEIKGSR